MKRLVLLSLIVTSLAIFSCNNADASDKKDESKGKTETEKTTSESNENEGAKPVHLTKDDFLKLVMDYESNPNEWNFQGEIPCIIDFYADWCRPCKMAAPIMEDLAKEYAGKINVYKVDTEKERELAMAFGIQSIPAFLFCPKEGNPQMMNGIGRSPEETKEMFKNAIDNVLLNPEKSE